MKTIVVKKRSLNLKEYRLRSALETDYEMLITESCKVVDEDGKLLILYIVFDDSVQTNELLESLKTINYTTTTRISGLKTTSAIFGYSPRAAIRKDFCSSTAMAKAQPKEHKVICDFGKELAKIYKQEIPDIYQEHLEQTKNKVRNEWIIEDTPFTSGIVNKNNPLKYHFDKGNFKKVYSNMVVFKGHTAGGFLSCPEYGIGFELSNRSALMFDGQNILHGVTPIKKLRPEAYRYSVVYYTLQSMWKCDTALGEVERIKRVKTQREFERIKLIKGYGK